MVTQGRQIFLWLSIMGAVIPLWPFGEWLLINGVNPTLFFADLSANKISLFAWLDVVVAAVVLLLACWRAEFNLTLHQRVSVTLATCCIGVSCGLPLLLYFWQPTAIPVKGADSD